jgi:ERCC4-type nuclease
VGERQLCHYIAYRGVAAVIQIDKRAGSEKLIGPLRSLGMEVEETILPYGDAAWMGYGANGDPVSCAAECKSVEDCIACIQSGRFAGHQLPGLLASYDHVWLLIVDEYRPRLRDGVLEYRKTGRGGGQYWAESCGRQRTVYWRDLESWLMTMAICGGIRIHQEPDYDHAALWLKMASNWFARDSHKSHKVIQGTKQMFPDAALLLKPTLARRVAAQLPGVAEVRSAAVAAKFPTLERMVAASERDWRTVDGLGAGTAKKVFNAIHGMNGTGRH